MNRVLLILFAVFAFAARSDGLLKCYMCDSLTNPTCGDASKEGHSTPVECNIGSMATWHQEMSKHRDLRLIASLFEVDHPQYSSHVPDVACAKTNVKMGPMNVTVRSCQPAKTPTVDPCRAMQDKLAVSSNGYSMGYCGLCYTDGCNGAVDIAAPKIAQLLFGAIGLMLLQAFRYRSA